MNIYKKIIFNILKIILGLILAFIILLALGFFAVRFNLTNVAGNVDENNVFYNNAPTVVVENFLPLSDDLVNIQKKEIACKLLVISDYADYNSQIILSAYKSSGSYNLAQKMILAVMLRLDDKEEILSRLNLCKKEDTDLDYEKLLATRLLNIKHENIFTWQKEEHWQVIREAVLKDEDVLKRVGTELKIQPRLILSVAIVEQLRLYYTQRELFERVFKPLKILANANKMAWGVMAIKEAAAIKTEVALKDGQSPFYLGKDYENILDFKTSDVNRERYNRLTKEDDHYYSYLYGGLIIKQAISQWQQASFPIDYRPEIIATLFNIGLQNSEPKADPQVGGSKIDINGNSYVFGSLAYEFYYSGDLMAEFPYLKID